MVQTPENIDEPVIHKKTSVTWSDVVRGAKPGRESPKAGSLKNEAISKSQNCSKLSVLKPPIVSRQSRT